VHDAGYSNGLLDLGDLLVALRRSFLHHGTDQGQGGARHRLRRRDIEVLMEIQPPCRAIGREIVDISSRRHGFLEHAGKTGPGPLSRHTGSLAPGSQ